MVTVHQLIHTLPENELTWLNKPTYDPSIKEIMIIATPDLDKWAVSGDLLLTSLFGLQESHSLLSFIQQLDKIELAGIVLKNNDYLQKVPLALINKCKKLELPLINIKSEIQYREIMSHFYQLQNQNTDLTESGLLQSLLVPTRPIDQSQLIKKLSLESNLTYRVLITDDLSPAQKNKFTKTVHFLNNPSAPIVCGHWSSFYIFLVPLHPHAEEIIQKVRSECSANFADSGYVSIDTLPQAYINSCYTLKILHLFHQDLHYLDYQKLKLDRILLILLETHADKHLLSPSLLELKEESPILFETLVAYFSSNGQISKTAAVLFVHPKTIHYRLHKIESILNINLANADQYFYLHLSCKMALLIKSFE